MYWTRYYLRWELNPKLAIHFEADNRQFFAPSHAQHQFISHVHVHKKLGRGWEGIVGATLSLAGSQRPEAPTPFTTPEWRSWQAVSFQHPVGFGHLGHRLRWEERFIRRSSSAGLESGYRFSFRLRYACTLQIPLHSRIQLKIGEEVMLHHGEAIRQAFDQNRIWVGPDFSFPSKRWNVEVLYLWLRQLNISGNTYFDRDVVRVTVGHKVS